MKIYKISDKVLEFITEPMKNWKVELAVEGKTLAVVKIQRCIFEGNALSPLDFVIAMISLIYLFRKCMGATNLQNRQKKLITLCTWTTSNCKKK